jgi:phosphonoacetaldehyde hydrolase
LYGQLGIGAFIVAKNGEPGCLRFTGVGLPTSAELCWYTRVKQSQLKAVILDWAGTVVDHGSRAPVSAFVRAFARFGMVVTAAEARGPMGLGKVDHIRAIGQTASVASAWRVRYGREFGESDVTEIFQVFEPINVAAVRDHADIIPGAIAAIDALRARGLRIAGTTGYTRQIMDVLEPLVAASGYSPELTVCAGDLPAGRPSPLMMWYAMAKLGVWPAETVVKVDDTAPGIGEGRAAGTWTVGIALTGNAVGLSAQDLAAVTAADRARLRERAATELCDADIVIDSIADLPQAVTAIEARLAAGERPISAASRLSRL